MAIVNTDSLGEFDEYYTGNLNEPVHQYTHYYIEVFIPSTKNSYSHWKQYEFSSIEECQEYRRHDVFKQFRTRIVVENTCRKEYYRLDLKLEDIKVGDTFINDSDTPFNIPYEIVISEIDEKNQEIKYISSILETSSSCSLEYFNCYFKRK